MVRVKGGGVQSWWGSWGSRSGRDLGVVGLRVLGVQRLWGSRGGAGCRGSDGLGWWGLVV